jgi:hypothetical protein
LEKIGDFGGVFDRVFGNCDKGFGKQYGDILRD